MNTYTAMNYIYSQPCFCSDPNDIQTGFYVWYVLGSNMRI